MAERATLEIAAALDARIAEIERKQREKSKQLGSRAEFIFRV